MDLTLGVLFLIPGVLDRMPSRFVSYGKMYQNNKIWCQT